MSALPRNARPRLTRTWGSHLLPAMALGAALALSACEAPLDEEAAAPEAAEDEETAEPSNEPSAENPTSAEDVDITADVALRSVNTALTERDGKATGFIKDTGDDVGMEVDILSGEEITTVVTNQEGTAEVETRDGGTAEDEMQEIAGEAEVPLLRAMEIARSESAGLILEASLESRDGDLVVWVITIEGPATENTVVIDAGNGAIVPEGDNPVADNNIGADPDTVDGDSAEDDADQ